MLTLKKVKELVNAPVHTKRVPSPKVLLEEGLILLRKEFEHGSHLTVYNSGYADIEKVVSEEKIRQLSRSIMDVLWFSLWNKAK